MGELDKIADAIAQVYGGIAEYRKGSYPQLKYRADLQIYPIVVTLTDWFLFGFAVQDLVEEKIKMKLAGLNIDAACLSSMPWSICAAEEFEMLVQVADRVGVEAIMKGKVFDPDKRQWTIGSYLYSEFKDVVTTVKDLFPNELRDIDRDAEAWNWGGTQ